MADMKIVQKWLNKADSDFNFGSLSLEDNDEFFAQICYLFQQAGEKYLKAYIVRFDLEFKKMHDLRSLLSICAKKDIEFQELEEECKLLTTYIVDTRYPASWPIGETKKEAEKACKAAKQIGEFVKKKIV